MNSSLRKLISEYPVVVNYMAATAASKDDARTTARHLLNELLDLDLFLASGVYLRMLDILQQLLKTCQKEDACVLDLSRAISKTTGALETEYIRGGGEFLFVSGMSQAWEIP